MLSLHSKLGSLLRVSHLCSHVVSSHGSSEEIDSEKGRDLPMTTQSEQGQKPDLADSRELALSSSHQTPRLLIITGVSLEKTVCLEDL